jgi:cytochrome c oxidase subunit II
VVDAGEVRGVSLGWGEPQVAVGILFAVLAVGFASVFVVVAISSRADVPYEKVQRAGYALRRGWLGLLLVAGVVVLVLTLLDLPYARGSDSKRTLVKVTGVQFFWSVVPDRMRAGTPIRFDVTSADVNHGFGIYDPHGHLVGSVQAMPGYHNKLDLTFDTPGTYRIRCLEFCGLNHAVMEGSFTVVPRGGAG